MGNVYDALRRAAIEQRRHQIAAHAELEAQPEALEAVAGETRARNLTGVLRRGRDRLARIRSTRRAEPAPQPPSEIEERVQRLERELHRELRMLEQSLYGQLETEIRSLQDVTRLQVEALEKRIPPRGSLAIVPSLGLILAVLIVIAVRI